MDPLHQYIVLFTCFLPLKYWVTECHSTHYSVTGTLSLLLVPFKIWAVMFSFYLLLLLQSFLGTLKKTHSLLFASKSQNINSFVISTPSAGLANTRQEVNWHPMSPPVRALWHFKRFMHLNWIEVSPGGT